MILGPQYQDDLQALPVDQREWAGLVSADNTKQIKVKSKKKVLFRAKQFPGEFSSPQRSRWEKSRDRTKAGSVNTLQLRGDECLPQAGFVFKYGRLLGRVLAAGNFREGATALARNTELGFCSLFFVRDFLSWQDLGGGALSGSSESELEICS